MTFVDPGAESLLAFWRDAGVVDAFEDLPQNRLTESEVRARAKPPAPGAVPRRSLGATAPDLTEAAAAAREAALAASDLQALSEAVAAFPSPALRAGARRAVFARGSQQPDLLVIGEAPGADDEREGQPFSGPAGRLLDRALGAAGLLQGALISQTVFWRPPGDRNPSPAEQAVCEPFLDRLITLAAPKVLLVLGAGPAKSVLKLEGGILSLRGRWREHVTDDGATKTPSLPTLAPAFLLRQPMAKKMFWTDLLDVAARLEQPSLSA